RRTLRPADAAPIGEAQAALERLGAELAPAARDALAIAVAYVGDTLRGSLVHLRPPLVYRLGDQLCLDDRTRRNLAVVAGSGGGRAGSLWAVIDRSTTAMGSRRIRDWLVSPTLDLARLEERYDAIETLVE